MVKEKKVGNIFRPTANQYHKCSIPKYLFCGKWYFTTRLEGNPILNSSIGGLNKDFA